MTDIELLAALATILKRSDNLTTEEAEMVGVVEARLEQEGWNDSMWYWAKD